MKLTLLSLKLFVVNVILHNFDTFTENKAPEALLLNHHACRVVPLHVPGSSTYTCTSKTKIEAIMGHSQDP